MAHEVSKCVLFRNGLGIPRLGVEGEISKSESVGSPLGSKHEKETTGRSVVEIVKRA